MIQRQDKVEKKRAPPAAYGSKQTVRNLLGELNSDKEYLEGIFMDKFVTWLSLVVDWNVIMTSDLPILGLRS